MFRLHIRFWQKCLKLVFLILHIVPNRAGLLVNYWPIKSHVYFSTATPTKRSNFLVLYSYFLLLTVINPFQRWYRCFPFVSQIANIALIFDQFLIIRYYRLVTEKGPASPKKKKQLPSYSFFFRHYFNFCLSVTISDNPNVVVDQLYIVFLWDLYFIRHSRVRSIITSYHLIFITVIMQLNWEN